MTDLFWSIMANPVKIYPFIVGDDIEEEARELVERHAKTDKLFEYVKSNDLDISDCAGISGKHSAHVYLLKMHQNDWMKFQKEITKMCEKKNVLHASITF